MAPVLGYWDIRGQAEMSRLLLRYCKEDFEDKRYVVGPAPDFDRSDWTSKKYTLGLEFPNLPYYIDGDYKLTQSAAILEYIADKHDMIPNCKKLRGQLHMLNGDINDFRMSFAGACYSPDFTKLIAKFKEGLPQNLTKYEKFLGDKPWLMGEKINYPDFNLCEFLNQLVKYDPKCLDGHPKVKEYLHRFENLPQLKEYMSSDAFKKCACNGKSAQWRGGE